MDREQQLNAWFEFYVTLGLRPFPLFGITNGACRCKDGDACANPGKHPKKKGWRTADPEAPGPLDNLGLSTDEIVVVDFDAGQPHDDLPPTFTVSTGRGWHLWYWADPEHPIKSMVGWRPKVDIRAKGGLVAAPPSRHKLGHEYVYVGGEIQPVPYEIIEVAPRYHKVERREVSSVPSDSNPIMGPVIDGLVAQLENAQTGERNQTAFVVLCRFFELADKGWAGEPDLDRILRAGLDVGLTVTELQRTAESASRSLSA